MPKALSALAALALLAGCSLSSLDADADVHIEGRALDASGRPLANTEVLLLKQADLGEVLFGAALVVGTLSTVCLLPDPPALCDKARRATTDDDGFYEFDLKGSDTQGTLGTESTLSLTFAATAQTSTTITFTAEGESITLPDARLVRLAPVVTNEPGVINVHYARVPKDAGADATYSVQLFERQTATPLWSEPTQAGKARIDERVLEDKDALVAVGVATELAGGSGAGDVRSHYLSPRMDAPHTASLPMSRGRPCAAVTGQGKVGRFGPCPLTDGNLAEAARLSGKGVVTGVAVDLGSRRPIRLVVARGFGGQVLVELSDDGKSYRTITTTSGSAFAYAPRGNQRARYVRLRSPSGLDQSLSSEVAIW